MPSPQPVTFVEGDLVADGASNYKLGMVSPPVLLYGGTTLQTGFDIRGLETNFAGKIAWRKMLVDTNYPDSTWNLSTNERSADGEWPEGFDVSGAAALWGQVGVFTKLTSAGAPKGAFCRAWGSVVGGGWVAARQRIVLQQGASDQAVSVGAPFPCAGVSGLMFGFVYTGVSGTISTPRALVRTFKTGDTTNPGAWTSLTTGSNVTADSRGNTPSLSVSTYTRGPRCWRRRGSSSRRRARPRAWWTCWSRRSCDGGRAGAGVRSRGGVMRKGVYVDRSPKPDLSSFLGRWSAEAVAWSGGGGCGCGGSCHRSGERSTLGKPGFRSAPLPPQPRSPRVEEDPSAIFPCCQRKRDVCRHACDLRHGGMDLGRTTCRFDSWSDCEVDCHCKDGSDLSPPIEERWEGPW